MSREETFNMITQTQKNLEQKFGSPDKKNDGDNAAKFGIPSLFDLSIPVPFELIQNKDGKSTILAYFRVFFVRF